jgi:hypothetical protein
MIRNKAQLNTLVPVAIRQYLESEADEFQVSLSDVSRHYLRKGIGEKKYTKIMSEGEKYGR